MKWWKTKKTSIYTSVYYYLFSEIILLMIAKKILHAVFLCIHMFLFSDVWLCVRHAHLCLVGMSMKKRFYWFWYPWGKCAFIKFTFIYYILYCKCFLIFFFINVNVGLVMANNVNYSISVAHLPGSEW